jgi:hypothetical protein
VSNSIIVDFGPPGDNNRIRRAYRGLLRGNVDVRRSC